MATNRSNLPPADANPLADRLAEQHGELTARTEALVEAYARVPDTIDESTISRASDFVRQLQEHGKLIEATRVHEKEEFLAAGRTVDAFFKRMAEQLQKVAGGVNQRITAFLKAKVDAERRAREEEARRQREEAQRQAEEARKAAERVRDDDTLEDAVEAEQAAARQAEAAREAERLATAPTADLARTRSALGGTATIATTLDFDIFNHDAAVRAVASFIDAEALARAVRAYTRTYKGEDIKGRLVNTQPVPGVRFYLKQAARVV